MPEPFVVCILIVLSSLLLVVPVIALIIALRVNRRIETLEKRLIQMTRREGNLQNDILRINRLLRASSPTDSASETAPHAPPVSPTTTSSDPRPSEEESISSPTQTTSQPGPLPPPIPASPDRPTPSQAARQGTRDISRIMRDRTSSPPPPIASDEPAPAASADDSTEIAAVDLAAVAADIPHRRAASSEPQTKKKTINWEEHLGARLPIWIGAIAMALAGAFMVKYSFDNNLVSEPVRVALTAVFGVGLLILAEWLYSRASRVAAGLVAAGIAALFADVLAAIHLYELISGQVGFAMLGILAALAIVLSLKHGVIVATIGLVGGFATPALIGESTDGSIGIVFGYLFLLQTGLLLISRKRAWWPLAIAAVIAAMSWVGIWGLLQGFSDNGAILGLFVIASAASTILLAPATDHQTTWNARFLLALNWLAAVIGMVWLAILLLATDFQFTQWVYLAILATACLIYSRRREQYHGMAWLAGMISFIVVMIRVIQTASAPEPELWLVITSFTTILVAGSFGFLWRSAYPGQWATLSVLCGLAFSMVGPTVGLTQPAWMPWWAIMLVMTGIFLAMAIPLYQRRPAIQAYAGALAAYAVGVTSALTLSIALGVPREWIAPVWALQIPVLIELARRLDLPILKRLAAIITAGVLVRLVLNPWVLIYPIGSLPIINWLLWGYGLPIAALLLAAWRLRIAQSQSEPLDRNRLYTCLHYAALALFAVMTGLMIRHGFSLPLSERGGLFEAPLLDMPPSIFEAGTYTLIWGLTIGGLMLTWYHYKLQHLKYAIIAMTVITGLAFFLLQLIAVNPLLISASYARPEISLVLLNDLLYAYGLPLAMLIGVCVLLYQRGQRWDRIGVPVCAAIALSYLLVLLLVRHGFHGPAAMGTASYGPAESSTLLIGLLMICGILQLIFWRINDEDLQNASFGLSAVTIVFGLIFIAIRSPLFIEESVGSLPILNLTLYLYGVPALLIWGLSRFQTGKPRSLLEVAALLLAATLVLMITRQWFHGAYLDQREIMAAESYAYSAVAAVFGLVLLGSGIATQHRLLRYASLVVMMLTASKVFLLDTAHLQDLYRVFSFLGLGVSLFLIAFLYQKFVFSGSLMNHSEKAEL